MSTNPERMTKAMPELSETTIVVTGANSGLGYEATRIFAEKSATVVMACRSTDRGEDAAEAIAREAPSASLDVLELDLADLDSVRDFAAAFTGAYDDLHMLCNNAGVMAIPRRETADGFETQFGVNHLGHFALTGRLLDTLVETEGETRVVTQSSKAHESGEIDFDSVARSATESANGSAVSNDPQRKRSYDRWAAYGQSKLANVLFAYELDRRLGAADHDVTSVACHPGYAATELQRRGPEMENSTVRKLLMEGANRVVAQSAEMGALPIVYAATASTIRGGEYIGPDGFRGMRGYPTRVESSDRSHDREVARRLWDVSEELTGVSFGLEPASSRSVPQ
jgi:NAD(P)-dependent dehydrogenase (short-subunit alcohol dehydrogenase family)